MKSVENRALCEYEHEALTQSCIFPEVIRGKFYGDLYWPEWLSEDANNVAVYRFAFDDMVSDFIDSYYVPCTKKLDSEGKRKAVQIIRNLEQMIATLREVL